MTAAAVGFAFDAGSGGKSLTAAFAFCYVAGCVAAVLAVRQSGVFTAVIQPPLVLFLTVPSAYFVLTGGEVKGVKDLIINCGYPLIERFPLMFFTSAAVVLIGGARWYIGTVSRRAAKHDASAGVDGKVAAAMTTTMSATDSPRRSRRTATARAERAAAAEVAEPRRRSAKPAKAASTSRSRHNRPPDTELVEPVDPIESPERRPKRPRSARPPEDLIEPRRRSSRANPPQESRRTTPPGERRSPYERPERSERAARSERPDRPLRGERTERSDRPERRRRAPEFDPFEGRPAGPPTGRNGSSGTGTHHPVSRVRYRADDGEPQPEPRSRPRRPRDTDSDSRDYGP